MFRKVLMTGGAVLLTLSAFAATFGATAGAQEQSRAPVPTTPTSGSVTTLPAQGAATTTTQPATTVERSTDVANTGPHDYVAWVSLAGVASVALGISMRGRRADGNHWRAR